MFWGSYMQTWFLKDAQRHLIRLISKICTQKGGLFVRCWKGDLKQLKTLFLQKTICFSCPESRTRSSGCGSTTQPPPWARATPRPRWSTARPSCCYLRATGCPRRVRRWTTRSRNRTWSTTTLRPHARQHSRRRRAIAGTERPTRAPRLPHASAKVTGTEASASPAATATWMPSMARRPASSRADSGARPVITTTSPAARPRPPWCLPITTRRRPEPTRAATTGSSNRGNQNK